jgi:hypothetical protein|tara:strand:- start:1047 stop:1364 length:318 start_codon:yes stop_codon:yes gene_type:complete
MIRGAALAMTAACMAAFLCAPVAAHDLPCGPREKITKQLRERYGEVVIMRGIVDGAMMELYYAPTKNHTWTVVVSRANGVACLLVGGDNAQLISPSEAPPEGNSI